MILMKHDASLRVIHEPPNGAQPTMPISAEFPYESRFIEVNGSKMHYVEEGEGDPILLLHGNPTSSYLWRNIIPHLSPHGRVIAPDLIGMGRSDKPDIPYRFADHSRYLEGFIEAMDLKNVTLVIHDWGSGLGFHYASRHEDNVRGIAFMEALVRPMKWSELPSDFRMGFRLFRTPGIGFLMNQVGNFFVRQILPQAILRTLSDEELARYQDPYKTIASRKPVAQWPREIPIDGSPADMQQILSSYSEWLQRSEIPKLMLYATPGGIITADVATWVRERFPNLQSVPIGEGLHFVQEDEPDLIGEAIASWLTERGSA